MADLNSLRNERQAYYNLKNVILQLCPCLLRCKNALDASSNIELYFKIDDVSIDNGSIKNSRDCISGNYNFLLNQVLPEIDAKIQGLNSAISLEEQRIENERRAREEAERRAREEAERRAREETERKAAEEAARKKQTSKNYKSTKSSKK